jgi:hypothetical protein
LTNTSGIAAPSPARSARDFDRQQAASHEVGEHRSVRDDKPPEGEDREGRAGGERDSDVAGGDAAPSRIANTRREDRQHRSQRRQAEADRCSVVGCQRGSVGRERGRCQPGGEGSQRLGARAEGEGGGKTERR